MHKDGPVQPDDAAFLCLCETGVLRDADEAAQLTILEFSDISNKSTPDLLRQNNGRGNSGNGILNKL